MWFAGGIGLLAGVFLILLLPRFLPFSVDTHVAAIIMGQDRWSTGRTMIQSVSPSDWRALQTGGWLYQNNTEAVDGCISDMEAAGEAQSCTITVPVIVRGQ